MKMKKIRLEAIDLEDDRFRTSYFLPLGRLTQSIQKVGLLSPPRLRAGIKGWVILAGWKRILACRELGLSTIPALVVTKGDDLSCFIEALEENLATREVSLLEKSIALSRLDGFGVPRERLIREFMPWLGLPATAAHLEIFLSLVSIEDETKRFVAEKNPLFSILEDLLRLKPAERKRVLPFLRPLGQNKQKELLSDLLSISRRENASVSRVLASVSATSGIACKDLTPLEKAEKLRAELRLRRYPRLSQARAAFAAARKSLTLPESILIEPDPTFEDPALTVSFRCRTSQELRECLARLEAVADKDCFVCLFSAGREKK